MFGHRFFGARYFGQRYFGEAGGTPAVLPVPPISAHTTISVGSAGVEFSVGVATVTTRSAG